MNDVRKTIHKKIIELAAQLGHNAKALRDDQEIPGSGLLDSPALMELIIWFENTYEIEIDQDQLTIENFGTIDAMAAYLERART
jgi:acyl carrier protein